MRWTRLGIIFGTGQLPRWAISSALQPTPHLVDDSRVRVFAGFRDADGRSRVGFVDLEADQPDHVLLVGSRPSLDLGAAGSFDADGVVPCAVVERGGALWLYYAGYRRGDTKTRFTVFGGLAVSQDGGESFERLSDGPVLGPSAEGSLFRVLHSILPHKDGWRVWYGAGSEFRRGQAKTLPVYDIRCSDSPDGLSFAALGQVCIAPSGEEHRVGRPYVFRQNDSYRMFYGAGSERVPYQLRLADSDDGQRWRDRTAQLGLPLSQQGWDSEMMAYPAFVRSARRSYLLYNGNRYGHEGFGCAVLAEP